MIRIFIHLLLPTLFLLSCGLNKQEKPLSSAMDEASERLEFELKRLSDPATGRIPDHIRQKELAYAQTLPSDDVGLIRRNNAVEFVNRGPWNVGGRTRAFGIDISNENRLVSGSTSGGMWLSENSGKSWKMTTTAVQMLNPTCLVQDKRPGHTQTWFFGTGEAYGASPSKPGAYYLGDGLFKSSDSGKTWSALLSTGAGNPESFSSNWQLVWNLAIDESANDTLEELYAATYGALYRSENGGKNWSQVRTGGSYFTDVAVTESGVVYATLSADGTQRGIWRSVDGKTFTNITPANFPTGFRRIVIGIDPNNENRVYFLANTPGFGKVTRNYLGEPEYNSFYRYTYLKLNGADTNARWDNLSANLPATGGMFDKWNVQGSYDMVVAVRPGDSNTVIIGGTNLYRSKTAFNDSINTTFIGGYEKNSALPAINSYLNHHPDQHGVAFMPSNPKVMLSYHDGGVCRTNDIDAASVTWESLNNGYLTTQFYTVAIDKATVNDPVIVAGAQDNGSWFTGSESPQNPWTQPRGGDGSYCAIAGGKSMYYLSIQNAKMMKAVLDANGKRTAWARIDPIGLKKPKFINPFALDPRNNNVMYLAGGKYLYRNHNLAGIPLNNSWDSISTNWTRWEDSVPVANAFISSVHVCNQPASRVYYGTDNRRVYRVDNAISGTPKPVDITSSIVGNAFPFSANVSCITTNPNNGDEVLVSFSNYNVNSIFRSPDGGKTWQAIGGNLEPANGTGPSVRWLSVLPVKDGIIYLAATSTGLYATTKLNGNATIWVQQGSKTLGFVVCDMIETRPLDGTVVVATHGNGIFSAQYNSVGNIVSAEEIGSLFNGVKLFPNPAQDLLQIAFNSTAKKPVELQVYDESGRLLKREDCAVETGENTFNMNTAGLKQGVYYLQIFSPGGRKCLQFVISR